MSHDKNAARPDRMARLKAWLQSPATRRRAMWAGVVVGLFGVLGVFAAPPLLKSVLLRALSAELRREVSIERIDVQPYALAVTVQGLSVKAEDGHEVFGVDEIHANASLASLFQFGVVVDELRIRGPRLAIARLEAGRYDISDLLDEWLKPKPPTPTPRFSLNNIQISGGQLTFDDRPLGRQHTVRDLTLQLPFVSSLAYYADVWVEPGFSATIDDAPLVLKGRSRPFAQTHESELALEIDGFDLTRLQPYLPASLPFALQRGRLDSDLRLTFRMPPGEAPAVLASGDVALAEFDLRERSGEPLVAWHKLALAVKAVDPLQRQIHLGNVMLTGLQAHAQVDRQGRLNWLRVADALSAPAPNGAPAAPAPAAVWSVDGVQLADGRLRWRDQSGSKPVEGEVTGLQLTVGAIDSRLDKPLLIEQAALSLDFGERLRSGPINLSGGAIDLARHRIDIAALTSQGARLRLARERDGALDWLTPPQLKAAVRPSAGTSPAVPWVATLQQLKVDDLGVDFEDRSTTPAARQVLDRLQVRGEGLSTEAGKAGKLALNLRINEKGTLKAEGPVQLTPLKARLALDTVALPLLPLQPYFSERLAIALTRGQVSGKGELTVELGKAQPDVRYQGSLTVGDLLTVDKVNNADLLKWKSLYLGGIDVALSPLAVQVGEVALSDFYARLIVSPAGKLNLAEIVRPVPGSGEGTVPASTPAPASVNASASKPTTAAEASPANAAPPITIGRITLQGGTINFSDYFVKPNYTVNVTKVGGRIGRLSSTASAPADLELRGVYANTAPVNITARLNPLAARAYLDLKAEVTGVDLVPFSPYSGKYAGYAIEKGKLSLNVTYKLENGQLNADNGLFIDQLTFGDKVDSPTATSLPVNLAIALLKNNRGEIDLHLPIAGSLDDPQFSIGGLVVKVIVNLFVKAVTSPFALLGSLFGGGEELSSLDFAPGRVAFSEAGQKKLESLAKALRERAGLKLEITGRADPEADREGLKRAAIDQAVRAEKQKEMIRKGRESGSLETLEITAAEYPVLLEKAYKEAKFPKPRNLVGLLKTLPVEEMEKLMLTNLPATPDDVRQLAGRRAEAVQSWLVEQGQVPAERIFLLPPKVGPDDKGKASRVDFSLR